MVDALLGIVAPHPCYKCGKTGGILCTNCKYDITLDIPNTCLLCGKPAPSDGICRDEKTAYTKAWHVGDRIETIKHVIDAFKFEHTYEAHQTLADLLAEALGNLPTTVTVVPLPTISAHRRQRGYDHILLLARAPAKRKQLTLTPVIKRQTNTVQRDASRAQRLKQARQAFIVITLAGRHLFACGRCCYHGRLARVWRTGAACGRCRRSMGCRGCPPASRLNAPYLLR